MKATGGRKLEIATPNDRDVVMTRAFDAPRALVFDYFTKPEYIRRWMLGPDGWSMPVCDVDLRPGGSLRYVWRRTSGDGEFGCSGIYREVVALERIVHVERFDGDPDDALVTTTFTESGASTVVTMTVRYASREKRDAMLEMGMAEGLGDSFDRLEEIATP